MAVVCSISETYDLSTVKDKMTLIGIHTPKKELIQKTYPGLCMNSKYFRIVKTDVIISCVSSSLAITPDMVGDNSVDGIAPEDMLNPILYKAVSNDSWSTLEARLQGLMAQDMQVAQIPLPLSGNQAFAENDGVTDLQDEFGVYYSLLANRDGFKVAPIQRGLAMRGLKPLVFEKYYSHGENSTRGYEDQVVPRAPSLTENSEGVLVNNVQSFAYGMRGRPHPMPRINTSYLTAAQDNSIYIKDNGMGDGTPKNAQIYVPDIEPVMLAAILMPPCRKTKLFFRMVVRTYLEFSEVRPIQEIATFSQMSANYFPMVYHSDYNEQSSKMDTLTDMVDVKNAEIEKIMEGR